MEDLSPRLVLTWSLLRAIEKGEGFQESLRHYIQQQPKCFLSLELNEILRPKMSQLVTTQFRENRSNLSPIQIQLLILVQDHLRGESIYENLKHLEEEAILQCEQELADQLNYLPYKMLLPLMCFIFPALMLIFVSPLLRMLHF